MQKLFDHSKKKKTQIDPEEIIEEEVPRYFNFPLKGEDLDRDEVTGMKNVVTDFKEIVRPDERADKNRENI
jgi:hypothetical protein